MKLMMTFMKAVKEDPMNVGPLRDQMLAALGYDLATSVFSIEVVKRLTKRKLYSQRRNWCWNCTPSLWN